MEMMKNLAYRPWLFKTLEYHSATEYLNRMSEKGYEFYYASNNSCWASYRKNYGQRQYQYCVDLYGETFDEHIEQYKALCKDGGWEHLCTFNKMQIFRAPIGEKVAPIRTDAQDQWENLKETSSTGFTAAPIAGLTALMFMWIWAFYTYGQEPGFITCFSPEEQINWSIRNNSGMTVFFAFLFFCSLWAVEEIIYRIWLLRQIKQYLLWGRRDFLEERLLWRSKKTGLAKIEFFLHIENLLVIVMLLMVWYNGIICTPISGMWQRWGYLLIGASCLFALLYAVILKLELGVVPAARKRFKIYRAVSYSLCFMSFIMTMQIWQY